MKIIEQGPVINVAEVGDLQAALDAVPASGGTVHIPAGKYEIDRTVQIALADKQHLFIVGEGRGTVLINADINGGDLLHITGREETWWPDLKITLRDLTLVGNYDSGDALVVEYPNDTMIDGCFFFGHGGKAVYLKSRGANVVVRDCWMRDCKRGVYAENIHHLTFHGNQTRSRDEGQVQAEHVYLDANCREIRIVNNHLAYGHAEGIILEGTVGHVIASNTIEGFTEGIKAIDCQAIVIDANYLRCPTGIYMTGKCRGFNISGNQIGNAATGALVVAKPADSGGHSIVGNIVRRSYSEGGGKDGHRGIDLGDTQRCVVSGNVIEGVTEGPAIAAGPGGGQHVITSNNISKCNGAGLAIEAKECLVANNLVE